MFLINYDDFLDSITAFHPAQLKPVAYNHNSGIADKLGVPFHSLAESHHKIILTR